MTAINRNPHNTNILQPTKFLLTFDRIGSIQYFCQSANLPGISLGEVTRNTPFLDIYSVGNKLSFNAFNVTFIVDENLITFSNLLSWLNLIASPQGTNRNSNTVSNYSDGSLTLLTNLNNSNLRIQFYNMFPTSLSDIDFDTKSSADDIITATASFRYDYYDILPA